MLQIVLSGAAGFTPGEWTFVVPLASVDASVPGKMATGGESTLAGLADILFLVV